jgi:Ca2+/Na+ antiporter
MNFVYPRAKIFRYPPAIRRLGFILASICIGGLALVYAISGQSVSFFDVFVTFLFFALLLVYANLEFLTHEVRIDDLAITERTPFSTKRLEWTEVQDLINSSRLIVVTGSGGSGSIALFRGDYGFSLEPFEELRDAISQRLESLLVNRWREISLAGGRTYMPPPFSIGQILAYLIPVSLIIVFLLIVPISMGHFRAWGFVLLLLGLLTVAPFLLRDYRRSKTKIILGEDGIAQKDGESRLLLWQDVARVIVREPVMFGYGLVTVVGSKGERIHISRRIRGFGELMFLLMKNARSTITNSFEY